MEDSSWMVVIGEAAYSLSVYCNFFLILQGVALTNFLFDFNTDEVIVVIIEKL